MSLPGSTCTVGCSQARPVLLSDTRTSLQGLAMSRCTTLSWYAVVAGAPSALEGKGMLAGLASKVVDKLDGGIDTTKLAASMNCGDVEGTSCAAQRRCRRYPPPGTRRARAPARGRWRRWHCPQR